MNVPQLGAGAENIQFLEGESVNVGGAQQPEENAETALVYATFWIERATNKNIGHSLVQLQYAQFVMLDFPIFHLLNPPPVKPPTPPTVPVFVNLLISSTAIALGIKSAGAVRLLSRNANDFSTRYPSIARALVKLPDDTIVDGEVVALADDGRPSLQRAAELPSCRDTAAVLRFRSSASPWKRLMRLATRRAPRAAPLRDHSSYARRDQPDV